MKKLIIKLISTIVIFVVIALILICVLPFSSVTNQQANSNYKNVMSENITTNPKVVDIAMLGAHDAFSGEINFDSDVDPAETGILANPIVSTVLRGFIVRATLTQKTNAQGLYESGVRYVDVRISYYNDAWYTKHSLISGLLSTYLIESVQFLNNHPGEFIIFDLQHVYLADQTYADLFNYIDSIQVGGLSLLDYADSTIDLADLTYNDITKNKSKGGAIILAKTDNATYANKYYAYDSSIRSFWHDKISDEAMVVGIKQEYEKLFDNADLDRDKLRVNQAQKTAQISMNGITDTIKGWSLIDLAKHFNPKLVNHEDFSKWLEVMPIFMVDYATSPHEDFNRLVNQKINEFNSKLN